MPESKRGTAGSPRNEAGAIGVRGRRGEWEVPEAEAGAEPVPETFVRGENGCPESYSVCGAFSFSSFPSEMLTVGSACEPMPRG